MYFVKGGKKVNLFTSIIAGLIAGWLAGIVMDVKTNLTINLVIGMVGGVVGGFLMSVIGFFAYGLFANIIVSFIGACLFLFVAKMILRK